MGANGGFAQRAFLIVRSALSRLLSARCMHTLVGCHFVPGQAGMEGRPCAIQAHVVCKAILRAAIAQAHKGVMEKLREKHGFKGCRTADYHLHGEWASR